MELNRSTTGQLHRKSPINKKIVLLIGVILLLVVFSAFSIFAGSSDRIYKGICVLGEDLGGKTKEEAEVLLTEKFFDINPVLTFAMNSKSLVVESSLIAEFDCAQTAQAAFEQGREGGFFSRGVSYLKYLFKKENLGLSVELNEVLLEEQILILEENLPNPLKDHSYEIKADQLIVTTGHGGNSIDLETTKKTVLTALQTGKNATIELVYHKTLLLAPDVDELYERFHQKAENAEIIKADGKTSYKRHVLGIDFDKEAAKAVFADYKEDTIYTIELIITYPEITEEKLTGQLFKDVIATFSTPYNAGEVARTQNMSLAASKINGYVLDPGQTFSFNGVVGPRTIAAGYQNAKIFENGRIVDGLAGGICQISTTVHNAALFGCFEIIEKKNHSFPVSYAPKGQDATVTMGAIDYKFKNNSNNPIKITTRVSGGTCTVTILGTKEHSKKVSIENNTLSTTVFTTKYVDDVSVEPGTEKIVQKGSNGYAVESFRVISENGNVIARENMGKSYYIPLAQEIARYPQGEPANAAPYETLQPTPSMNPSPSAKPSETPHISPAPTPTPTVSPTPTPTPALSPTPVSTPTQTSTPLE